MGHRSINSFIKMSQEKGHTSARYRQEPLFRPEGPEFEPIPLEKRKAFQFRRGPTGKALYAAYFGVLVAGHYVYATGAWEQRDLYAERQNVWGSVTTYLQAEADRKYLQTRKRSTDAEEKLLFPKEVSEGKRELNHEEAQYKTRWVRPATDPFQQWHYVKRT